MTVLFAFATLTSRTSWAQPQGRGEHIVYVNFDGVTLTSNETQDQDATQNISFLVNSPSAVIPAFDPSVLGSNPQGLSRQEIIDSVIDYLYMVAAPYDLYFVTERPASGPYRMVVVGGTMAEVVGSSSVPFAATLADCDDLVWNNIAFVFPTGLDAEDLGTHVVWILGFTLGLKPIDNPEGVMYWDVGAVDPPTGFASGHVYHPNSPGLEACDGSSFQDADQILLHLIGERDQDFEPPDVVLDSPPSGSFVRVGDPVVVTATDDRGVHYVELSGCGLDASKGEPPFEWRIPQVIDRGVCTLKARGYDDFGNPGTARATVYVATGDEATCDDSNDCGDGFACLPEGLCVPEAYTAGAFGSACAEDTECVSALCKTAGDQGVCTRTCDDEAPCPGGFSCSSEGWCAPASSSGCLGSIAPTSRTPRLPTVLAMLGILLFVSRRRRRCRATCSPP